jgi:Raf kinase inhibitor-like YbhB/YbcL family protein
MTRNILATLFALSLSGSSFAADTAFTLQSPDITDGKPMTKQQEFNGIGCNGGNVSPALSWSGVPEGTKSLALTVYDPDAPTGSGWWHWVVFNLPADTRNLPAKIDASGKGLPAGAIQSRTDFGKPGFGGACPPAGDPPHRYHFTLHALKTGKLDLSTDAMPAMVGFMLHANELGQASLTATYQR